MSRIFEEILEAIWMAEERNFNITEEICKICHVKIEDNILDEMKKENLITKEKNNIYLTEKGRDIARSLIRRKRLAEELLVHVLDIRGDKADTIVCEFEHGVIPEVEESICILLGHPPVCPHNRPIPPGSCCISRKNNIEKKVDCITDFRTGEKIRIAYIKPASHQRLHKLLSFGIKPGIIVEIHQKKPVFILKYENTEIAMDSNIASNIFGWKHEED